MQLTTSVAIMQVLRFFQNYAGDCFCYNYAVKSFCSTYAGNSFCSKYVSDNCCCNYAGGSLCCNYAGGIALFLQCIIHMTVSILIMQVTVSVIVMSMKVSSNKFIFLSLTPTVCKIYRKPIKSNISGFHFNTFVNILPGLR